MADIDLPVLSFRANWAEGVVERLSFLTTVLKGEEGAEQRFSNRVTPRRSAEVDFTLTQGERTFYDLFIHRHAGGELMVPLYWDASRTTAAVSAGVTDRVEFDTRWTEFTAGTLAMLQRKDAQIFEVVEIAAVDDTGIDLVAPVTRNWAKGTTVLPLRRALIEDMGSLSHPTAAVAGVSVQIGYTVANPLGDEGDDSVIYGNYPLFLTEPNWVDTLDMQYARDLVRLDNDSGLPYQVDPTGRANVGQAHRWLLRDRQARMNLKRFLYRRRGRAEAFWVPTFKADLELAQTLSSSSTQAVVNRAGLVYSEVPTAGRDHVVIFPRGSAPLPRRITNSLNGLTPTTERMGLDLAPGLDLSPGQVRKISFLDTAKFDQDEFEFDHKSATVSELNAAFRTFKDSRNPAGTIHYPIPVSNMTADPCGVPGPCYIQENVIKFRFEYHPGYNGRYGGLLYWLNLSSPLNGDPYPTGYMCNQYVEWQLDLPDEATDIVEQFGVIRSQGRPDDCPIVGGTGPSDAGGGRLLIHKPGWPVWRAVPGRPGTVGLLQWYELPNPGSGIGYYEVSGWPVDMWFNFPANPDEYCSYTVPYEGL